MNKSALAAALGLALAVCGNAHAAKVTLLNIDAPGAGLNDTTPAAPQGANPGTTVGDQRRIAYEFAADLWGAVLESDVEIKVYASFTPLACTAASGVLGSAGANWIVFNFPGADPDVLYHSALGDAIAGEDLVPDPSDPGDILSRFNANLGQPGCLESSGWYYGLDGNTPAGSINFLNVVMHEIGHGLGFSGFVNKTTGALLAGLPDVYTRVAYDNQQNLRFTDPAMTNALRAVSMRTPGRTVWDGSEVNSQAALILDDLILLRASGTLAADFTYGTASFGPAATASNFTGALVIANDGVGDTADACEPLAAGSLAGKIAFTNRGTCGFEAKALNAQNAGAIGVVIGNVAASAAPGTAPGMADDPLVTATVPTISLNLADGDAIRAAPPGVNVTLGVVPGRLAGADANGRTQLYSPTTVATGSTFSHFDTALVPNALMEPAITSTLRGEVNVDLTPALFDDIGWTLNSGNARIGNCTTNVDVVGAGGLIPGANVQAWSNLCLRSNATKDGYQSCMEAYKTYALGAGILVGNQGGKVMSCAAKII
ncbi:MAG TPA: PA domain-containing protein, partial [Pseudoxanthomonas sp.]